MKVANVMQRDVASCSVEDPLSVPAQLMWDRTVGSVVVLTGEQLAGLVTDRDIAMSAQTQGRPLREIPVKTAMAGDVVTCGPDDRPREVVERMIARRVRRCPVVDGEGRVVGLLSLDDLAAAASHRRPGGLGISRQRLLAAYAATAVAPRSVGAQPFGEGNAKAAAAALAGEVTARARRAWSEVRRSWSEAQAESPGRNRAARLGARLVRALSAAPGALRGRDGDRGDSGRTQLPS
jgi:CBS domain-containing protein